MVDARAARRAGRRLSGRPLRLEVQTPDATLPVSVHLERVEVVDDAGVELWVRAREPGLGVPGVPFPCRPSDPALALYAPEQRWEQLLCRLEQGRALPVVQPDGDRPCPTCGSRSAGPYCGGCGERLRVAPMATTCPADHATVTSRHCRRCGLRRAPGAARRGRFRRLG